jgi:GDP-L-fucose synthase
MSFWSGKRVVVTGGFGFLGSRVVEKLKGQAPAEIFVPRRQEYELVRIENIEKLYRDANPHIVLHLTGEVGGIGANRPNPGRFFYNNLMLGIQLMESGRTHAVEEFMALGTICAYPKLTPVPFREDNLWNGYPEETNVPYGLAKKMLLDRVQAYRQQYGFNAHISFPSTYTVRPITSIHKCRTRSRQSSRNAWTPYAQVQTKSCCRNGESDSRIPLCR